MRLRRVVAATAATVATLLIAPISQASTAPPLHVEMGDVECQDMSQLPAMVAQHFDAGPDGRLPHVRITVRGTEQDNGAPYTITVDGTTKGQGYVGARGVVITGVTLTDSSPAHIVVRSNDTVLAERTVTAPC